MISEGRRAPDLGMPTQAGNNLLYNLTRKAKSEKDLECLFKLLMTRSSNLDLDKSDGT